MCMRNGNRKHTLHATMFSLVTSLHMDDLMKFNYIGKECAEEYKRKV